MKKLNTDEFIQKSKQIHGDKYDYSKTEYINSRTKVCIICPEHGPFYQTGNAHLSGQGCPVCSHNIHITTEMFINQLKEIYGNKYDYSKVEYINSYTKVCIICPEHGPFYQTPNQLKKEKVGCPKCTNRVTNVNEFIQKSKQIHGDKYDYSKVEYINNKTKVCIICPEHGPFYQTPGNHVCSKQGCPKCANKIRNILTTKTKEEFILSARKIHGDKYDYSKVKYINNKTKVCIIDIQNNKEFYQTPANHLKGFGYNKIGKRKLDTVDYIEKAKKIYGDLYDYKDINYKNLRSDITLYCKEKDENGNDHGYFLVNAQNHLHGRCCPLCSGSSYEKIVSNELHKNDIKFIYQCGKKKLKCIDNLFLDFYLPDYNIAIECQGKQHFEYSTYFHIDKTIDNYRYNDIKKYNLCKNNNIDLIYFIPYDYEKYNIDFYNNDKKIFKNIDELMNYLLYLKCKV